MKNRVLVLTAMLAVLATACKKADLKPSNSKCDSDTVNVIKNCDSVQVAADSIKK